MLNNLCVELSKEVWEEVVLMAKVVGKVKILIDEAFMLYEIVFVVVYVQLGTDLSCDRLPTIEVSFVSFLLNF